MKNLAKCIKEVNRIAKNECVFGGTRHIELLNKLMEIQAIENAHELEMAHRRSKWQTVREFFSKHYGLGGGSYE